MKKNISSVLEITDSHVKFFQAKGLSDKRVITSCVVRPIVGDTEEELVKIFKEILHLKNIVPDELVLILPRRLTILKQMRLPSHHDQEISQMIGLQLVNKIPYALEDVIYDYHLLGKETSGYTQVLVIVVLKEVSERYLKILNRVGVKLSRLTLSSLGILDWLIYQESKKMIETRQAVGLINMDTIHSEICFCHNKSLLYSRNMNYGAQDLKDDNLHGFMNQIELSLKGYQKESMGPEIGKILIVSPTQEVFNLRDRLKQEFNLPIQIFSPLENVLCQKNLDLSSMKHHFGLSLTAGFGMLFSDTPKLVNLAPREIHQTRQTRMRKRQVAWFVSLILLFFILSVSAAGMELYRKNIYFKKLEDRIIQTKPTVKATEQKMRVVHFLEGEFQDRIFIPDLILNLYRLTPPEISFRSLSLDEKGGFVIQGYGETSVSVNDFQANLVKSSVFKEINLEFATKRRIFNMDVTDFKITSQLIKSRMPQ
ncbi:MAG TPA: hypothetical protein DD723_03240 [Candidatus Omnitrophica bacterium]|nr:MAG: hypothetical protein A2Z81_01035 [Omnitrophica WOR_2 bacterium GWA2_45_18]OGX19269.1 MAG: hypothetical protein A2Y04_00295 [Omnitrophica WOR_2 bacterium GWC2_45_7]HBR14544.1 hypothetical protein [Candidatus Omnitrophota bacterium]